MQVTMEILRRNEYMFNIENLITPNLQEQLDAFEHEKTKAVFYCVFLIMKLTFRTKLMILPSNGWKGQAQDIFPKDMQKSMMTRSLS